VSDIKQLFASFVLIVLLVGFSHSVIAEEKFAIAADGAQVTDGIASLAGIAPYFHFYDINGNPLEVFANPHLDLEFGTGPAAAASLADMGVTVLIAQRVPGPKMHDVLIERNIRLVRRLGTVQDVVDELKEE
jgi:predicted Fe-Mo cluster-binding NifX family protein